MLERKKVIDANVERVRTLRDNTKALYDNGFVEKTDADRIEVTYNNLTSEQEKFNRLLVVTEQVLKFQMGMDIQQPVTLTDRLDIEEVKKQGAVNDNVDPAKRIEYGILQTQMRLQEYNVKRYQSGYLPSLVAYGSLSAAALRTEFTIFNPDYRWYPTGIIGATLNVPIFDGLQKSELRSGRRNTACKRSRTRSKPSIRRYALNRTATGPLSSTHKTHCLYRKRTFNWQTM